MEKKSQNTKIVISGGFLSPVINKRLCADNYSQIESLIQVCKHIDASALVIPEHLSDNISNKIKDNLSIPLITNAPEPIKICNNTNLIIYDSRYITGEFEYEEGTTYLNLCDQHTYSKQIETTDYTITTYNEQVPKQWNNFTSETHDLYIWQRPDFPIMYITMDIGKESVAYDHNFRWFFDYDYSYSTRKTIPEIYQDRYMQHKQL